MPVTVIAEAGVNHNGDIGRALALVDAAAEAGADIVKFQTFRLAELVTAAAPKAEYQTANDGAGSQMEMLARLELKPEAHFRLAERCRQRGIRFLSTPFDIPSLRFLVDELAMDRIKVPSGEITNAPLLLAAAGTGLPVILSTGMSTLDEVREALGVLAWGQSGQGAPCRAAFGAAGLPEAVTLLHCTTEYPTPFAEVNLRAMATLHREFGLPVGFSDHSVGIHAAMAAVALGAVVIEKHFTLDRTLPGPDHKASLEPDELAALVRGVRDIEAALGDGVKAPQPSELKNMTVARKVLVALAPIRRGEPLSPANLGVKRAGRGISPMDYWARLGTPAARDFAAGEALE
jgi:N-acetylneuraminate synthase